MRVPDRPYPIGPLLDAARIVAGASTEHELALALGMTVRNVSRWKHLGVLSDVQADRAAVALGLHPGNVWPELWWAAAS